MRWVKLTDGTVYATNYHTGGVFVSENGLYRQIVGDLHTPVFTSSREFRQYIRKSFKLECDRIVDEGGWNWRDSQIMRLRREQPVNELR